MSFAQHDGLTFTAQHLNYLEQNNIYFHSTLKLCFSATCSNKQGLISIPTVQLLRVDTQRPAGFKIILWLVSTSQSKCSDWIRNTQLNTGVLVKIVFTELLMKCVSIPPHSPNAPSGYATSDRKSVV